MDKIIISRSFSQKIKIGDFLTADFFSSAQAEANSENKEKISQELFDFCKNQVEVDISEYKKGPNVGRELWDEKQQKLAEEESQLRDLGIETAEAESK